MSTEPAYRYALYYAPRPDSLEGQAGSRWLGRCAAQGAAQAQTVVPGVDAAEFRRLTAAPRRYGWHGTLKAPFALAEGVSLPMLRSAVRALCATLQPFAMPALRVDLLDDFLALVPAQDCPALHEVARTCVTGLQPLAAPLPPAELQRRRAAGLTPEEDALLLRWGYPFVLERYRFHCSLTGPLRGVAPVTVDALRQAAREHFEALPPCRFDAVALFAEPTPGADFVLLEHVPLGTEAGT